ncbi:MAG: ParB/RepB/Spo0J family partition protein [Gammaproteobacteria bacterium]|nr:ParB/RepB/Spo0J family partition protein [Gammaproteobacteria bacterium]
MADSNRLFDRLAADVSRAPRERARNVGLLEQRDNELSELTSGTIEDRVHRWVDPACCRMWPRHNRRYDLLTQARCQDLIDGFRAQGRQEFPAVVRKLDGDPQHQYEVVCGARRHWTVTWLRANNYPEFRFLIEVRELTDEQAFRLSDIENRDNLDLSDYERAVDYKDALGRYYSSQKEMAGRLEVSEAWLSRYLDLAALPDEIVQAFGDVTELRVKHGRDLKPYLRDRQARERMVDRARGLAAEDGARQPLAGAQVVRELLAAAATRRRGGRRTPVAAYRTDDGKLMVSVDRRGRAGLVMRVTRDSGATKEELLEACRAAIEEHL